jgi:hypothetical protein
MDPVEVNYLWDKSAEYGTNTVASGLNLRGFCGTETRLTSAFLPTLFECAFEQTPHPISRPQTPPVNMSS